MRSFSRGWLIEEFIKLGFTADCRRGNSVPLVASRAFKVARKMHRKASELRVLAYMPMETIRNAF
jgi:hypothetical protein